jgi:hypothetical protein
VPLRCHLHYKGDRDQNPSHFLHRHFFLIMFSAFCTLPQLVKCCTTPILSPPAMATSHPHLFQQSIADESKIFKLVANCFLPDHAMLQWHPATGEDIPAPNTNEIVVFSSFFQHGFGLPACDFLHGLLQHYQIELVHLNPNSILQIAAFVHLCEAFPGIPPKLSLIQKYFFLKYQPSTIN